MFSTVVVALDSDIMHRVADAELVQSWTGGPTQPEHECRREQDRWWLYCPAIGAARFESDSHCIEQYVRPGIPFDQFQPVFEHEWLPLIYQCWGDLVLHASAAVRLDDQAVVVFAGATGAGKSTFGFGLGQRPHWQQIADDSLALSPDERGVIVQPLPNAIRLRPQTAAYYRALPSDRHQLEWPDGSLTPRTIYIPEPAEDVGATPQFVRLSPVLALNTLLQLAYVLDLNHPASKRLVTRQCLDLMSRVPVFRLRYRKQFSAMEATLDAIEAHSRNL